MTHDTKAAAAFYSDVIGWDAQENQMPDNRIYTVFTKGADDGCGDRSRARRPSDFDRRVRQD